MADKMRIDRWLWSVRIFKSRSMATMACKTNKIKIADRNLKPSYQVSIEDEIVVHKNGFRLQFIVKDLLKSRVSATLAQECYINITPEEELNKYKSWFIGKAASERREKGAGRPTKRDRREIDEYKWDQMLDFFDDDGESS